MQEFVRHGVDLMDAGKYFEAHEYWEEVWKGLSQPAERDALRAVIQLAVGLHHAARGNHVGADGVLRRALRGLESVPDDWAGVNVARLRKDIKHFLESGPESLPKVYSA